MIVRPKNNIPPPPHTFFFYFFTKFFAIFPDNFFNAKCYFWCEIFLFCKNSAFFEKQTKTKFRKKKLNFSIFREQTVRYFFGMNMLLLVYSVWSFTLNLTTKEWNILVINVNMLLLVYSVWSCTLNLNTKEWDILAIYVNMLLLVYSV